MYLMGVDIGTSSAKAIIMSPTGELIAEAQEAYSIREPQPGYRVQDPDEVLQAVLLTMKRAIQQLPDINILAGISFSAAMHSLMAVDVNGKPLTPLMLWADTRSIDQSNNIKKALVATELYENCGVPIHPMTPLCKIMWLRENEPVIFTNAHKFISIKEYLFHYLAGEYVIDHSIASSTGLFDIHRLQWYQPALELAGITAEKLSKVVPVFHSYTNLQADAQTFLGIPNSVQVIVGSSDGCLANLGSGVTEDGDVAVTISTSMAVRITSSSPFPDAAQSLFNYAITPDKYICGGGSNNGSLLLHWMAGSILENNELLDPELFMKKALTAPAGCDGLMFLPYLLGERAPVWDANATGIISGFQFHHRQQHLMRALVEGLTMNACIIIERLVNVSGNIRTIKASGGFTNSQEWVQMLADISNLPVTIDNTGDASAIGAIMIAGFSLGMFEVLGQPFVSKGEKTTYYPDRDEHEVYQKNYEAFKRLYTNNHPA
jgi:gluconokinase